MAEINQYQHNYGSNNVCDEFGKKKNDKNKKSKNKEKHKKYIRNKENNKIHKKLILIPNFFFTNLLRMLKGTF